MFAKTKKDFLSILSIPELSECELKSDNVRLDKTFLAVFTLPTLLSELYF